MKPPSDAPRPRGFRGVPSKEFTVTSQQEGHIVHGVPDLSDDESSNRWDGLDDRDR